MTTCKHCREPKEPGDFYVSNKTKCRECIKSAVRENRIKRAEYYKAYDRERYYEGGLRGEPSDDAKRRASRAWGARNKAKRAAHSAVARAVLAGTLTRPVACEACSGESQVDAHHGDYDKPLDVAWLCKPCHSAVHRLYSRRDNQAILARRAF